MLRLIKFVAVIAAASAIAAASEEVDALPETGRKQVPDSVAPVFTVPANEQVDWDVDSLGRVRVLVPAFPKVDEITEDLAKTLFSALKDPEKYVTAHVILSQIQNTKPSACAIPVVDGFDILFHGLNVEVRYGIDALADEKIIHYPTEDMRFGTQHVKILSRHRIAVQLYERRGWLPKLRMTRRADIPTRTWADNTSHELNDLTNERVTWRFYGFGSIHPRLLKVHRDEIAADKSKHVPHLISLLTDKSRFVGAHVALSAIYGVDSLCVVRRFRGYDVYLNGLHIFLTVGDNFKLEPNYPNAARQQAWLQHRWMLLSGYPQKQNSTDDPTEQGAVP